ncbi:MAG: hypothetical protein IJF67_07505, partial [Clostridia bacterium]|nr:hypothetical protein [Clostridia bacterium]
LYQKVSPMALTVGCMAYSFFGLWYYYTTIFAAMQVPACKILTRGGMYGIIFKIAKIAKNREKQGD